MTVFSRGGFSRLTFLEVIFLRMALSSLIDLRVFTTELYSFVRRFVPCYYSHNNLKHGGKGRHLQICYSHVYCCDIALVPGLKEEKDSAKAQVACYSNSEKNRSLFLSEDVRIFKRQSKKEICLGFRAAAVLVRAHGSKPI